MTCCRSSLLAGHAHDIALDWVSLSASSFDRFNGFFRQRSTILAQGTTWRAWFRK
jgi:hypothetical protein